MTPTYESTPATNKGASSVTDSTDSVRRIGESVDAVLQDTLWKVLRGELELHNLTPGLSAWYIAGANVHGESCCQSTIDRLTRERDMWFECYSNGWTPGEWTRRKTDALWAEAVAA